MSYFEKSCSSAKTVKFILRSPYQASPSLQNYKPSAAPINSTLFFFLDSPKGHTKRSAWKCLLLCEACLVADYDVAFLIHQTCSFTLNKLTQARCLQNPLPLLLNLVTPLLPFSLQTQGGAFSFVFNLLVMGKFLLYLYDTPPIFTKLVFLPFRLTTSVLLLEKR